MAAAPILRPIARTAPLSIAPCSHIPHTCCCGHRRSGVDARRCAADPERDARARDQLAAAAARHHSSGGAQRAADNARHRTDDIAAESRTDRVAQCRVAQCRVVQCRVGRDMVVQAALRVLPPAPPCVRQTAATRSLQHAARGLLQAACGVLQATRSLQQATRSLQHTPFRPPMPYRAS